MQGYRIFYDEKAGKFDYDQFKSEAKGYSDMEYWNADIKTTIASVEYNNTRLDKLHKCKVCGKLFFLLEDEIEWFESRNLSLPKRCPDCRRWHKYK